MTPFVSHTITKLQETELIKPNESHQEKQSQKMAKSLNIFIAALSLIAFYPLCFCSKAYESGGYLFPQFYDHSCPKAQEIVQSIVAKAFTHDPRMPASLIRLHFHDCFVKVSSFENYLTFNNVWEESRSFYIIISL